MTDRNPIGCIVTGSATTTATYGRGTMIRRKTAVVTLMIASTGCATIGLGPPQIESQKTVSVAVKPVHKSGDATAVGTLDGKALTVKVVRQCFNDDVEFQTVETRTKRERSNQSAALDWTAGVAGVVLVGAGSVAIASPSTFGAGSGSGTGSGGSSSPPTSKGDMIGAGVVMVGAGIALGVIPIVDAVRASGSTREVSTQVVPGATVMHTACGSEPYANASVTGSIGKSQRLYGQTDASGVLHVDLWEQLPVEAITGPNAAFSLQLVIDGKPAGQVDVSSLPYAFEDTFWRQLNDPMAGNGGIKACGRDVLLLSGQTTAPSSTGLDWATGAQSPDMLWNVSSCAALVRFTQLFPSGTHAQEANDMLAKLRAKGAAALQAAKDAAEHARAEAAQQAAGRAAAERQVKEHGACVAKCRSTCSGDSGCAAACVKQNCS